MSGDRWCTLVDFRFSVELSLSFNNQYLPSGAQRGLIAPVSDPLDSVYIQILQDLWVHPLVGPLTQQVGDASQISIGSEKFEGIAVRYGK
jgi:hypothetical protein